MVDSSDEHESIVGWHCYADNETDIDAKMQRGIDAWSVSVELIFNPCNCVRFVLLDSFAVAQNDVNYGYFSEQLLLTSPSTQRGEGRVRGTIKFYHL